MCSHQMSNYKRRRPRNTAVAVHKNSAVVQAARNEVQHRSEVLGRVLGRVCSEEAPLRRVTDELLHALEEIDLNCTEQVDDAMLHVMGRHCPRLRTVNLTEDTQVTDRGVMHLARGCRRLHTLLLTGCSSVGDASLMALCDANLNPGLRHATVLC